MKKLPILLVMLALVAVLYFELHSYFSFESLKEHHQFLSQWTHEHPVLAGLIFVCVYIAIVAVSLPVAVYLNITAGFLFGIYWGTVCAVIGATLGAILIFLAVNTAFGKWLEQRAKGWLKELEQGFQRHAFNYLLAIRFIPVIPFWVVNIGAALFNIRLKPFIVATFFGIIPETALYTWMGSGLENMIKAGETPSWSMVFTPSTLIPLLALPILPLIPLIYHTLTKKRKKS